MTESAEVPSPTPVRQYHSEQINELAAALAKAQARMEHAAKGVDNTYFKSKYADLPAVYDASRKALAENGLAVVQVTEFDEKGLTLITTLMHATGQWMRSWYPIRPTKAGDPQALGSALTYARRYAYSALVGVAAHDEDDDGNAASGRESPKKETAKARNSRYAVVKQAILESDDPAATWHEHKAEIDGFRLESDAFYDDLVQAGKVRKQQLLDAETAKASFGEGFVNTPTGEPYLSA